MTTQNFCYWLQGFFEISGDSAKTLSAEQLKMIQAHLRLVFRDDIDPSMGDAEHQQTLNSLHLGNPFTLGGTPTVTTTPEGGQTYTMDRC